MRGRGAFCSAWRTHQRGFIVVCNADRFRLPLQLGSFALSEPGSGSDAFALATKATKSEDGSYYTLSGTKCWITTGGESGIFLVFATVDPSAGYKGISCFVVEKEMGIEIAKKEKKLGIRASSTCVLNFDEVKVPAENLLGEEGKGYK
jgi:short-chain 2-methylacyl-CoA dehydrogenase